MLRSAGFVVAAVLLAFSPVMADDLTGADRLVCAATTVVICWDDGSCETGSPMDLNLPQFVEIDLGKKLLSTTRASGLNRSTTIASVKREADTIILQGSENGRAFSYIIAEKTGQASAAIAANGRNVSAFGACTPRSASD